MTYYCFPFFNELELLEIQLNENYEKVDKFVLVESTKTHSGIEKPLFYLENKHLFQNFQNKIIHIIHEEKDNLNEQNTFELDWKQRQSIMKGLENCSANDKIIIVDVDEIAMNYEDINVKENKIYKFNQKANYYYLNNSVNETWMFPYMCTYSYLKDKNLSHLRMEKGFIIEEGGFHFTYLGDEEKIRQKLNASAHREMINNHVLTNIKTNLNEVKDLFSRPHINFNRVNVDESYPKYILKNLEKYKNYILQ